MCSGRNGSLTTLMLLLLETRFYKSQNGGRETALRISCESLLPLHLLSSSIILVEVRDSLGNGLIRLLRAEIK